MSLELDEKYQSMALSALHHSLTGYDIYEQSAEVEVDAKEILAAFQRSGAVLRSNQEEEHVRTIAECVFDGCIKLARCLYFPAEARTIVLQSKEYTLDARSQLENLRRNMEDLEGMLQNENKR